MHATLTPNVSSRWEIVSPTEAPRLTAEALAGRWLASYRNIHTRKNRTYTIKQFFAFLEENGIADPVHDVRRGDIDVWLRKLEAEGNKPSTVAQKIAGVGRFYRYLVREDFLDKDPSIAVERPHVSKESTRDFLSEREMADILSEAKAEGGYVYVLIALLSFNGLRISEILNANVEDLGTDDWRTTLRITRKGGAVTRIPLPGPTEKAIEKALDGRAEGPLLLNKAGHRMQREGAAAIIRRLSIKARIADKNIVPHSFRHSAITAYLRSGATVDEAADFAGHIDIRTTQRYDRRTRLMDAHGAYKLVPTIATYQR